MNTNKDFQRLCTRRMNELKKEISNTLYHLRKKDSITLEQMSAKTKDVLSVKTLEQYELRRSSGFVPLESLVVVATALNKRVRIVFEKEPSEV